MMYAQTNLQLYNQMRQEGYPADDLAVVHAAYDLATKLFTAAFRGSGKPLLAHTVGTASVLCAVRAKATLIAAGALHAAYIFGEFGDGRRGWNARKRAVVRRAVGPEVEQLIADYHQLHWHKSTLPEIAARIHTMDTAERNVLLIRLANELEDHLDLGVLYAGNAERRRQELRSCLYLSVRMSRDLGQPALADELQRVFDEVLSMDVPEALRGCHDYTYLLPPLSHTRTGLVALRQFLDTHPRLSHVLHPASVLSFMSKRQQARLGAALAMISAWV
jgi:(p)ppGpp synthase/HD superfamily hydrolase